MVGELFYTFVMKDCSPPDQHVIKTVRPVDIASDELLINIEASFLAVNLGSIYNNVWPVFDKLFTWFENNSLEFQQKYKFFHFVFHDFFL